MAKNINTDPKDTPMLKQYLELKKKHPDAIILYRVGDFYETFCDDAKEAHDILGITLTARAGDLDLYGQRDKIFLIRENEHGEREYHQLNINDAEIFNSPYYYLQQNDIVYVEPKKVQARNSFFASSTSMWLSLFGMLTSVSTFILALTK